MSMEGSAKEAVFLGLLSRAEEAEEKAKVYRTLAEIFAEAEHPDKVEFIVRAVKDPAVVRVISVIYSLYEAGSELAREVEAFFEDLAG